MSTSETMPTGFVEPSASSTLAKQKALNPNLKKEFLGHPVGLYVLSATEMWERFSYYGMRALLVLYMTKSLIDHANTGTYVFGFGSFRAMLEFLHGPLKNQELASQIYGYYTGFVYFTPFFGGLLADKILGQRKTVVVGGVLMAIGHFLMALESMFLPALFFLILGNGCFKPNISTQVGGLYEPGDSRRDRAFMVFYMFFNLGALFSPLVCGTLGQLYGWHYGFGAAGVGMLVGLGIYLWGRKYLAEDEFTHEEKTHTLHEPLTKAEWRAIIGLVVLCALNILFWAVYEQQGNSLQIFADERVNWTVFGWSIPSTWFQAINPAFIFIFGPAINMLWSWQSKRKTEPSSIAKMSIGCLVLGLSFLPLIYIVNGIDATAKISFMWLVAGTLIYTVGELYLSPVGLSLVTKVAPARLVSMMMGMWFLSSFFGNILSGYVGMYYSRMSLSGFFILLTVLAGIAAAMIFAVQKPITKAVGHHV